MCLYVCVRERACANQEPRMSTVGLVIRRVASERWMHGGWEEDWGDLDTGVPQSLSDSGHGKEPTNAD